MRVALKLAILASGKSQRQLAAEIGIPETRLSEIVRGWRSPTDSEALLIAGRLEQTSEALFAPNGQGTPLATGGAA